MLWTAQSVWHNSICVSVVDDIAGDDATAGACDEAFTYSVRIVMLRVCVSSSGQYLQARRR